MLFVLTVYWKYKFFSTEASFMSQISDSKYEIIYAFMLNLITIVSKALLFVEDVFLKKLKFINLFSM